MIFRFLVFAVVGLVCGRELAAGTSTSVTVSVSANPVLLGQPVTLTANVLPSGATGAVTFYEGVAVVGIASVAAGQATFTTAVLPGGINPITARFNGDSTFTPSLSPAVPLTVAIAPGTGFGGGSAYPLGDITLTPTWIAMADFNNDGVADLVTANTGEGAVSVLIGNGDGTFSQYPDVPTGLTPVWVMAADFNGDGLPDLAVVNSGDPSVAILLGNGDGSFQTAVPILLGSEPVAAAIADFDGDGNPDIAAVDANNGTVTILFGVGDGTLRMGITVALGLSPLQIAAADFNHDGKPDLAIAGSSPDGVAVLLGNGDGTFVLEPLLSAGTGPSSLATADFNHDGNADIAVGDYGDYNSLSGGGVTILLGNGNGTFSNPLAAASGPNVSAIAAADFDGDGNPDLGVISASGFSTYPGNGGGTLLPPQVYAAGNSPVALAIGSFDGTALTEVAVVNRTEAELDVLTGSPGTCLFSLTPSSLLYDGAAENVTASLTTSATGCPWTVSSPAWIVPQVTSGLGSFTVPYQITANTSGFDRSGALAIADQTLAISQRFTTQQFTDVPVTGYNFDAVNLLKNENITSGCGPTTYCPNNNVTRAQMAVFIVRGVYGANPFTYSAEPYFSDVPVNAFGFPWIQKMYELGITSGCGGGLYCPNSSVTRSQMAVFIIRARFAATATFSYPAAAYFADVPVGAFGFAWIQRMRLEGITAGCNATLYCPENPVTRGDMAIFIMRGLFNALAAPGTPALISVAPSDLVIGQPDTFTFTGSNSNFLQGQTTITTVPGVDVTNIQVAGPTSLTVTLSAAPSTPLQPVALVAITGSEQDVLPNSLVIQ